MLQLLLSVLPGNGYYVICKYTFSFRTPDYRKFSGNEDFVNSLFCSSNISVHIIIIISNPQTSTHFCWNLECVTFNSCICSKEIWLTTESWILELWLKQNKPIINSRIFTWDIDTFVKALAQLFVHYLFLYLDRTHKLY